MILFKCDRCGKVISPYVHRIRIEAFSNANYALDKPITTFPLAQVGSDISEDLLPEMMEGSHFCRDCIEQICAYAMNYNLPPADPVPEPEQKPEAPKKPARQAPTIREKYKNDMDGPIRSFWTANPRRSVSWIADEIGVSEETVRNHLKEMGLWKKED